MRCAFTIDGASGSQWLMARDQRDPTRTTKYVAWLSTVGQARNNATIWPALYTTLPGAAWATRLDSAFSAAPELTVPLPTGGLACTNGYHVTYIWYTQSPGYAGATVNITATVAGTINGYCNGTQTAFSLAVSVGTADYNLCQFAPSFTEGPLFAVTVWFKTGSGGTINSIRTTP